MKPIYTGQAGLLAISRDLSNDLLVETCKFANNRDIFENLLLYL